MVYEGPIRSIYAREDSNLQAHVIAAADRQTRINL